MTDAIRAKMRCNIVETINHGGPNGGYEYHKFRFGCVYGKEGENADYSKATPSGECWLQVDPCTKARGFFKPGKKYYVTFTEAPD